ncbi:hypothetical protein J6590_039110 [Homalodisca vitripennis]|nr:hypothetical protein J6590_039110 [Homalodisca vitripennis]
MARNRHQFVLCHTLFHLTASFQHLSLQDCREPTATEWLPSRLFTRRTRVRIPVCAAHFYRQLNIYPRLLRRTVVSA